MNLTDTEMDLLRRCKTRSAWDSVCYAIKDARQGSYPPDWYSRVIGSGLIQQKVEQFGGGELRVEAYPPPTDPTGAQA